MSKGQGRSHGKPFIRTAIGNPMAKFMGHMDEYFHPRRITIDQFFLLLGQGKLRFISNQLSR